MYLSPFNFSGTGRELESVGESVLELTGAAEKVAVCKFECDRVEYLPRVQYGGIDEEALAEADAADKTTVVQFYFETFDYEKHTLKQDTLIDFFCELSRKRH